MIQSPFKDPTTVPNAEPGTKILFYNLDGQLCSKDEAGSLNVYELFIDSADNIDEGTAHLFLNSTERDKLTAINVTNPINLDDIASRVNDLDAAVVLKDSWDASTGVFPGAGSAQAGWSYICTAAQVIAGVDFRPNDRIVALVDNASTTVYTNVWLKLDYTDAIASIDNQTGVLTLGGLIASLSSKVTLSANDLVGIADSESSNASKKVKLGDLFNQIMTWIGSTFQPMLYSGSNIKTLNGASLLGSSNIVIPTTICKEPTTAHTVSSITRTTVPNWLHSVNADKKYKIEIVATVSTVATATGASLGFIMSSGAASVIGNIEADVTQTTVASGLKQAIYAINSSNTTAGSYMLTPSVGTINGVHCFRASIVLTVTTAGVFEVQFGSEVAGSAATLATNSFMFITEF